MLNPRRDHSPSYLEMGDDAFDWHAELDDMPGMLLPTGANLPDGSGRSHSLLSSKQNAVLARLKASWSDAQFPQTPERAAQLIRTAKDEMEIAYREWDPENGQAIWRCADQWLILKGVP